MARFNVATRRKEPDTTNVAGGTAYTESPELEVCSLILTSLLNDEFYRTSEQTAQRLALLVNDARISPDFLARALLYARRVHGLRSITHLGASLIAKRVAGHPWARHFYQRVVYRPDDMLEILAVHKSREEKITNAMRKGFAAALEGMDAYALSKYRGEGKAWSLVDVVNLCHPHSTPAIKQLVEGTLRSRETWEAKLSDAGKAKTNKEKELKKAQAWGDLLRANKLGYMALLKNLRNIHQQAPDLLPQAIEQLCDRNRIHKAKVLPFQFIKALEAVSTSNKLTSAVYQAIEIALDNVPAIDGNTAVFVDLSGSMAGVRAVTAALFGAAVMKKTDEGKLFGFSNSCFGVRTAKDSKVVDIVEKLIAKAEWGGTNFASIMNTLEELASRKASWIPDRVFIFSDMQAWVSSGWGDPPIQKLWKGFCRNHKATPFLYSVDLAGLGTTQFPERTVACLSGLSEKIFDLISLAETDRNVMLKTISEYPIAPPARRAS